MRSRDLAAVLAVLAVAGSDAALADSRIFSVRSSNSAVTIDEAVRNGQDLSVVGRGDGSTLFRIESSASTPVPCLNRIIFVTSTGESIERSADFCALNWELTLDVAPPPPPAPPAPSPAAATPATPPATVTPRVVGVPGAAPAVPVPATPAAPPGGATDFTETVTISVDDPGITINEVFLGGQPVAIAGRNGNAVEIAVGGGADGIACQRDLGLVLSDGRSIARDVNICLNDWTVVVALEGGTAPPAGEVAVPLPTPPGPPPVPGAPIPGVPVPQPAENFTWAFSADPQNASLIFGVPQTDYVQFSATCVRGSGEIEVSLPESVAPAPAAPVSVTFSAGVFTRTYEAVGSPMSDVTGSSHPILKVPAPDGLFPAMIRESFLNVSIPPSPPLAMSLKGSAGPTRQLVAACQRPVPVVGPVGPGPGPVGPGPAGNTTVVQFMCQGLPPITVTFNRAQRTALVSEGGAPPVVLYAAPGSPNRFGAGPAVLVGEGEVVRWSRFGGPPVLCRPL